MNKLLQILLFIAEIFFLPAYFMVYYLAEFTTSRNLGLPLFYEEVNGWHQRIDAQINATNPFVLGTLGYLTIAQLFLIVLVLRLF